MAISQLYIPAFSIEDVLLDKDTGAPLSGGLVYFYEDNQRTVPKPVYQITGTSPNYTFTQLPNPMTLSSIGTFEDSLGNPVVPYFYPWDSELNPDYYYVEVLSSGLVPQFDRESVPYIGEQNEADIMSIITNELSNPQFVEVNFDTTTPSYTFNVNSVTSQVINLAPNWDIVVSAPGAGTVTVSQLAPAGTLNVPTNPATILNISSAGLSQLTLRQRLYGSPNLWGNAYIAGTFVAKTYSGTTVTLNMYYSQSNGTVQDIQIVSAQLPSSGNYEQFSGATELIPISNSMDTFPNAYVDIFFDIPLSIEIDLTSVMVAYTGQTPIDNLDFDQETEARQIDHLFNYYEVPLNFKPIPSLLVGWDFPLNPAQLGTSATITTTAAYIWDQTICQSVVGNIAVVRNTVTGGFQATTANNNEAFYQIQYLSGAKAKKFLMNELSVNVSAFTTQAGGVCTVKVYLFSAPSTASFPTLPTALGTINASGAFTLTAANWNAIPRSNLGQASGILSSINTSNYATLNNVQDLQFSGWQITDATQISNTDKIAIVVTYSCPTTGTVVTTNSISVVPGSIPTQPAPQTSDEVLRECQYYYEKSWAPSVAIGTATLNDAIVLTQPAIAGIQLAVGAVMTLTYYFNQQNFSVMYKEIKRTTPNFSFYSTITNNAINVVTAYLAWEILNPGAGSSSSQTDTLVSSSWTMTGNGTEGINYQIIPANLGNSILSAPSQTVTGSSTYYASSSMSFHYTADARLGVV